MGAYKNSKDAQDAARAEARRFNAAMRREQTMSDEANIPSRIIRLETLSEIERYSMAQNAERTLAFNKAVERWQQNVAAQMRAAVASRSMSIARELTPKVYTDKYGIINRLGFSFPRHGIYLHYGAGRGQGGTTGSHWMLQKKINGSRINTSIERHTNPASINNEMGNSPRKAYQWFDPIIRNRISELVEISVQYFDTMVIDATRIFIQKK